MKRSEINASIDQAMEFFEKMAFPLPPFGFWTPAEWENKGTDCNEIRDLGLGWDVTDFGSGDLANIGRTIFTLRNGRACADSYAKSYAHKVMCMLEGQRSIIHYHKSKMEDIINQGGGNIMITLWRAASDNSLSDEVFDIAVNGIRRTIPSGETVRLEPGDSVYVSPYTYHKFWAEEGTGTALSIEVSSVCNDHTDNFFLDAGERFPKIEEDEARRYYLCQEYPTAR
ncbi:MAG: D-lyxose/D-mannose family sugar isomerase [Candidatus Latescibacterota bacterium]